MSNDYPITSERGQEMMAYLPRYYESSRVMRILMQTKGYEIDKLRQALDEVLEQFFVSKATWGLSIWERELGLIVNETLSISDRRARILASLNSTDNCTLATIKRIAKSFTGKDPICYETDTFRAGISLAGDPTYSERYPFTIRRKFNPFLAGVSVAGDNVNYTTVLELNMTEIFRAGVSKAGDAVFVPDENYAYLNGENPINKSSIRSIIEKILPARMMLAIN